MTTPDAIPTATRSISESISESPFDAADRATVRVASFNILHGAGMTDGLVDLDRFADAVRSLDADILALQEVDHGQSRSGEVNLSEVAAEAMGAQVWCFVPVLPGRLGSPAPVDTLLQEGDGTGGSGSPGYGIAMISRWPAEEWRRLSLPSLPFRYPRPRHGHPRLALSRDEPRGAMAARFATPIGPLTVANAHLSLVPGVRERQLRLLVRRLRPVPEPFVLLGDLNSNAPWPARVTGLTPLATHLTSPADRPRRQIDHALTGGGVRAVRSQAIRFEVSDHLALVVDLARTRP